MFRLNSKDRRLRQVIDMAVAIKSNNNHLDKLIQEQKQLIKQGQNEERLFTIKDGEVIIARQIETGFVPLARLKKGDFFGRVPFLDMGHEPYSAAVFSSANLRLAAVDSDKLKAEHQGLSSTLKNIIDHLATSVSVTTRVTCDLKKHQTK